MRADAWAALGTWVGAVAALLTVGVAIGAAFIAIGQLREMRTTRQRVSQPNVVAFIDHNPKNWQMVDFVVKNFGQTPAYNIKVDLPKLQVSPYLSGTTGETVNELYVPPHIAVLAPGQEWRTFWDSAITREQYKDVLSGNPVIGSVTYWDEMNHRPDAEPPYETPIWIDPNMFYNMLRQRDDDPAEVISKAIAEVAKPLNSFGTDGGGIWVHTEPAEAERGRREARRQRLREIRQVAIDQLYARIPHLRPPRD